MDRRMRILRLRGAILAVCVLGWVVEPRRGWFAACVLALCLVLDSIDER
jgi:hypothetical protein